MLQPPPAQSATQVVSLPHRISQPPAAQSELHEAPLRQFKRHWALLPSQVEVQVDVPWHV
jgi:hypothetical protein